MISPLPQKPTIPKKSQNKTKKCLKEEVGSFGIYDSTVKDEYKTTKPIKDTQIRQ